MICLLRLTKSVIPYILSTEYILCERGKRNSSAVNKAMRAQHPRPRFYTRQSDALVACDVCILRPWAGVRCAGQLARSATAQVHFRCLLRCAPSGNMLFRTAPPRARNACSDCRVLSLWLGCAQRYFLSRCPLSRRRRTPRSKPRARRVESLEPKVRSVLRRARRRRLERRVRL